MSGETHLQTLIKTMKPRLDPTDYVFGCLSADAWSTLLALKPLGIFREAEGLTVIVDKDTADRHNIGYQGLFRRITLTVHSSLEAVGLTAAVATQLSHAGISANVVAAYYHDHIFVPQAVAAQALDSLQALTQEDTP